MESFRLERRRLEEFQLGLLHRLEESRLGRLLRRLEEFRLNRLRRRLEECTLEQRRQLRQLVFRRERLRWEEFLVVTVRSEECQLERLRPELR